MKYAIIGSRDFTDYETFRATLDTVPDITCVVSGGARGADSMAERYANEKGLPTEIYPADWALHGKAAGHIRNRDIIEAADKVIAFWDLQSKGTKGALQIADSLHKPFVVFITK